MSPDVVGDWLLLESALEPPGPTRSGPWRPIFEAEGSTLYVAGATDGWVGAPWREVRFDGGRAWLWGESSAPDGAVAEAARGGDASYLGARFLLLSRLEGGPFCVTIDRFGTRHAYGLGSGVAVSSCFHALSAFSARQLDWPGLTSFLACGFFLGEATFWRDVRCLTPARHHDVTGAGQSARRYWHWRHAPERRSYDDTVDAFARVFESAVDEATRSGRVALPLSGGLDSRALAAAVAPERVSWSYSYGYQSGSVEVAIGAEIARRRGFRFDKQVIPAYLPDRLDEVLDTVEGFQDVTQTRQLAIAGRLAAEADAVLGGHWGDVWLDAMGKPSEGACEAQWAVSKLRKRGATWLLDKLVRPHLERCPESLLHRQVEAAMQGYGEIRDADFRFKAFKTDHWSWRWTLASVRAYEAGAAARLPFYDARLADFFATVPTALLRDRRLEIDYLRRRAPDLASIPWQETGAGLHRSRRAAWWLGLPRRAAARLLRELGGHRVIERNWQVQLLGAAGRRWLEERLLSPGVPLHDVLDRAELGLLLDDFFARPTAASGYSVSMLLTFAAVLERP